MNENSEVIYEPQDHPWLEMPASENMAEEIRYSLDELRLY